MSNSGEVLAASHKRIVFIADDEATFRDSVQDALEGSGYLVLPARCGTEALARMHGFFGPALAIVDLNMPGMSGWNLIETMRADSDLAHIRILVVSAEAPKAVQGADRLLQKPVRLKDLLQTVAELTS